MFSLPLDTIEAHDQLHLLQQGDESAFKYFYTLLYAPLLRYGCRMVDDEFEVSCMAQEAFLRLWALRARVTSPLHLYRLLRLVLRWSCSDYYRLPASRFHHYCISYPGNIEKHPLTVNRHHLAEQQVTEQQAQAVEKVIAFLPQTRQTVLQLHYKYGLSCGQIAARFRTSNTAISLELQRSLDSLRKMIQTTKQKAKRTVAQQPPLQLISFGNESCLPQQVYHLRNYERKGFEQIATALGLTRTEVQLAYLQAVQSVNKTTSGTKTGAPCLPR